jgi:prevent-host-death family protein
VTTIGVSEAKKHFSNLLDRVARGVRVTITRRGVPVALLLPLQPEPNKLSHQEVVEGMRALRERVKRSNLSVGQMVSEGREY